jgi:hypothetical protein
MASRRKAGSELRVSIMLPFGSHDGQDGYDVMSMFGRESGYNVVSNDS